MEEEKEVPLKSSNPRVKRWAPKSKTGCRTCRIRRIKCDEGKPLCQRCLRTSRECAGYDYVGMVLPAKPVSYVSMAVAVPRSPASVPQINGSAEVRDLMSLFPLIAQYVELSSISNTMDISEFILSRRGRLASYVTYLPCRLGRNPALDTSVKCLAAIMRDACLPPASRQAATVRTFALYARALRSVQRMLDDPVESLAPETLCATQLLGIFESFIRDDGQVSSSHKEGTSRLLEVRGPKRFTTDFEKNLFISQAPFVFTSSILGGQSCFLEQPEWMAVLRSTASSKPQTSDRTGLYTSILALGIPLARIFSDCNRLINNPEMEGGPLHLTLLQDIKTHLRDLASWHRCWHETLLPPPEVDKFTQFGRDDSRSMRMGVHCTYEGFILMYNRLHATLDWHHSAERERQSQKIANDLLKLSYIYGKDTRDADMIGAWGMARAIQASAKYWDVDNYVDPMPRRSLNLVGLESWRQWTAFSGIQFGKQ